MAVGTFNGDSDEAQILETPDIFAPIAALAWATAFDILDLTSSLCAVILGSIRLFFFFFHC